MSVREHDSRITRPIVLSADDGPVTAQQKMSDNKIIAPCGRSDADLIKRLELMEEPKLSASTTSFSAAPKADTEFQEINLSDLCEYQNGSLPLHSFPSYMAHPPSTSHLSKVSEQKKTAYCVTDSDEEEVYEEVVHTAAEDILEDHEVEDKSLMADLVNRLPPILEVPGTNVLQQQNPLPQPPPPEPRPKKKIKPKKKTAKPMPKSRKEQLRLRSKSEEIEDVEAGLQYPCPECNKVFQTPSKLKRHFFCHSGEKPFRCDKCRKGFSQKANMQMHRMKCGKLLVKSQGDQTDRHKNLSKDQAPTTEA